MRIFLEYLKVGLWMLPIILPALWLLPRLSKRYAARVSYVIWLVLAVRLLIPWNLTLPQETAPSRTLAALADWRCALAGRRAVFRPADSGFCFSDESPAPPLGEGALCRSKGVFR